jgi:hypothetical protein
MARTIAVSLLTKTVSPISLLTSPVMVARDILYLKKATNLIHDNGPTLSLMSKVIADAIGLTGETRPLALSTIGTPNLVQQAFKATVNLHDSEGNMIGKVRFNVVPDFVDVRAVDWSTQAAKFRHLASINFPTPFIEGKCHNLLGNDSHHMSAPTMNIIKAMEEPQSYPYAAPTPLGWCAAGPTLLPVRNDPVLNLMVKTAVSKCREDLKAKISKAQTQAEAKGGD